MKFLWWEMIELLKRESAPSMIGEYLCMLWLLVVSPVASGNESLNVKLLSSHSKWKARVCWKATLVFSSPGSSPTFSKASSYRTHSFFGSVQCSTVCLKAIELQAFPIKSLDVFSSSGRQKNDRTDSECLNSEAEEFRACQHNWLPSWRRQ